MATAENNSSRRTDWLIFFVSLIACFGFIVVKPEWFWVTLPFVFTYLVRAMDRM